MSLGIRPILLLASLVLITVVDLGVGMYLEVQLRGSLEGRFHRELTQETRAIGEVVKGQVPDPSRVMYTRATLDPIADRFGEAMEARVSVIGPNGALLADSELGLDGLSRSDDHGGRPEVVAAREGVLGVSRRHSATIDTDMLYVAQEVGDGSGRVVRVSVPLSEVDEAVRQLRWTLVLAGFVALAAAGLLALGASRLVSSSLKVLVATAQHEAGPLRSAGDGPDDDRGGDGGSLGSVEALADDLRRTVRLLGNERERFETVLETMGQAVLALDAEHRINTANRAARELLGLPDSVEGRPLLDFMRVPALQELIADAAAGAPASTEFDYGVSPRRHLQAQATASRQGGGTVIVMRDVTELRRLETIRKDFIANVSHELRTPVAVIQANAETLLAGAMEKPESARVFLDAMARHADRMGRLVSDLLDISRIEAGRYRLEMGPVDLVEMVERTIAALVMQAQDKGTHLERGLDGEHWIAADDKALEQILFNLISNAIKYTQDGGHVEIDAVVVEHEGGEPSRLRVEVRDDGPGIDPRHHGRLFERFYRVDSGRTREMGGTGLGLAIVKHLVEAMGGQVGVDARRPRGSVFWFTVSSAAAAFGGAEADLDADDGMAANDGDPSDSPHAV